MSKVTDQLKAVQGHARVMVVQNSHALVGIDDTL